MMPLLLSHVSAWDETWTESYILDYKSSRNKIQYSSLMERRISKGHDVHDIEKEGWKSMEHFCV